MTIYAITDNRHLYTSFVGAKIALSRGRGNGSLQGEVVRVRFCHVSKAKEGWAVFDGDHDLVPTVDRGPRRYLTMHAARIALTRLEGDFLVGVRYAKLTPAEANATSQ